MAVLFPIRLDGKRFFVNPTNISVQKRTSIQETRTMAGTTFQVWPDMPDEVKFEGLSFGIRSILELRNMSTIMERNPDDKETVLTYKYRKYRGYVRDLTVSADADKPRQFKYNFTFLIRDPRFVLEDMTIGQLVGAKAEFDFVEAQLRGVSETIAAAPLDLANNLANVSRSIGRINLNIGRPKLP